MEKILKEMGLVNIENISALKGGDVSAAYKVYADGEIYFLKIRKNTDESFFDGEKAGLEIFNKAKINAPRPISIKYDGKDAYFLLTFHEEKNLGSQEELAELVAKIHDIENPDGKFGFSYPYRGSVIDFSNAFKSSWKEIFLYERLDKLKDYLLSLELWDEKDSDRYDIVRKIIENELDKHESKSVLLHGDLWAGNFIFDKDNKALVFDPSPIYGDREFDIGVSTVFGGFRKEFYDAYRKMKPLDEGYQKRLEFYRLYLLMVHLLKFGKVYDAAVSDIMKKIIDEN